MVKIRLSSRCTTVKVTTNLTKFPLKEIAIEKPITCGFYFDGFSDCSHFDYQRILCRSAQRTYPNISDYSQSCVVYFSWHCLVGLSFAAPQCGISRYICGFSKVGRYSRFSDRFHFSSHELFASGEHPLLQKKSFLHFRSILRVQFPSLSLINGLRDLSLYTPNYPTLQLNQLSFLKG